MKPSFSVWFRNISIKWKVALLFVGVATSFLGTSTWLARRTFESDKMNSQFREQQREVSDLAERLQARVDRVVYDARTLLAARDPGSADLPPRLREFWQRHPWLRSVELVDLKTGQPVITWVQEGVRAPVRDARAHRAPELQYLGEDHYLVMTSERDAEQREWELRILARLPDPLSSGASSDQVAFVGDDQVLKTTRGFVLDRAEIGDLVRTFVNDPSELFLQKKFGTRDYLVSSAAVAYGNFRFLAFVPREAVLGSLNPFLQRSVVFAMLAAVIFVLLSFLLFHRWTQNLRAFSRAAGDLAQGDFQPRADWQPLNEARDEFAELEGAILRAGESMRDRLDETARRTLIEAQRRTAEFVRRRTVPTEKIFAAGNLSMAARQEVLTGEPTVWWSYQQRGDELDLVVTDAGDQPTAVAAMIAAAGRAVFSLGAQHGWALNEWADHWNEALLEAEWPASVQATFLRINVKTGKGRWLSAGHTPLVFVTPLSDDEQWARCRYPEAADTLGRKHAIWRDTEFQLEWGERLVVYTNGLTATRAWADRVWMDALERDLRTELSPSECTEKILAQFPTNWGMPARDRVVVVFEHVRY